MLFRFLTLATISITYLSVQAASSTETRSQRHTLAPAFNKHDLRELPSLHQLAMAGKRQASQSAIPPLPKSFKSTRKKLIALAGQKQIARKKQKLKTKKTAIIRTEITKKVFVRLAYMPSSYHPDKTDLAYKAEARKALRLAAKTRKTKLLLESTSLNTNLNSTLSQQDLALLKPKKKRVYRKPKYSLGAAKKVAAKKYKKKKKYYRKRKEQRVHNFFFNNRY